MRRNRIISAVAVIVAFGIAIAVFLYNPFAPGNLDDLLSKELGTMESLKVDDTDGMTTMTRAQLNKKWENNWKKIEKTIQRRTASDSEARGVITAARKHFSYSYRIYGVPVQAKRIWYRFHPVWIIQFRWGVIFNDPKGLVEPPSHIRVLGIDAHKPYKILGMQTCS